MHNAENLVRAISRCTNVDYCLSHSDPSHTCAPIVQYQQVRNASDFQVPEPWTGHLDQASVLFVSSNPSISMEEEYPRGSWSDELIRDYFVDRFDSSKQWIKDGTKTLYRTGKHARATAFWAAVRQRAIELLDSNVVPGLDYTLTEVVHCKSKSEFGVEAAESECSRRFLRPVLEISVAKVIVVLGKTARESVDRQLQLPPHESVYGPADACGRERFLVFLPHPNARGDRTLSKCLEPKELDQLRAFLYQSPDR